MHKEIIGFIYKKLVKPKSKNEDAKRQEFILNILIIGSIFLSFMGLLFAGIDFILHPEYVGLSLLIIFFILLFFILLLFLSKKRLIKLSAYLFIVIYFLPTIYMSYVWGVDLPITLLLFSLIIIISGILIDTKFAFISTLIIFFSFITLTYLQSNNILNPNTYWREDPIRTKDNIVLSIIFFIIATVSWLSNREIEKSLKRARNSEKALKKERDSLEEKVEERTKEIKKIQQEKMEQIYHLAKFGRLSAGLFHDLINPLTAVSLNLEQIEKGKYKKINDTRSYLKQAIAATKNMENLIVAVRKQIKQQETKQRFSLVDEIIQIIQILNYRAQKADVKIIFKPTKIIKIFGDSTKFNQAITNIIANAIDSYEEITKKVKAKTIEIKLSKNKNKIILTIEDCANGIPKEIIDKVFEPFFTTKNSQKDKGIGIGLSSTKKTIENDFGGKLNVKSCLNKGTKFIIKIPA